MIQGLIAAYDRLCETDRKAEELFTKLEDEEISIMDFVESVPEEYFPNKKHMLSILS